MPTNYFNNVTNTICCKSTSKVKKSPIRAERDLERVQADGALFLNWFFISAGS
jgi:hypothetical protein